MRIQITCQLVALLMLGGMQQVIAQQHTVSPLSTGDSVSMIKQLLRQQFEQQLKAVVLKDLFQKHQLEHLINDSTAADSLSQLIFRHIHDLQKSSVTAVSAAVTNITKTPGQLVRQQLGSLMQTVNLKDIIAQFTGIAKQSMLQWNALSVVMSGQAITAADGQHVSFRNNMALTGSGSLVGIPISLRLLRQDMTGTEAGSYNTASVKFDRDAYLNSVRDKIKEIKRPRTLLPGYNEVLQKTKAAAITSLQASLDSLNQVYKGGLSNQLAKLGNTENLLQTDMQTIKTRLLSGVFIKEMEQNNQQLVQLQQALNTGETIDTLKYNALLQTIRAPEGSAKLVDAITTVKKIFNKATVMEASDNLKKDEDMHLQQLLQDPVKLSSLEKESLGLTGMQKIFLNINQLATGMNTVSLSPLSVYRFAGDGFNVSFFNNKTFLFVMAGKQININSLFSHIPDVSTSNGASTAYGMRAGHGNITQSYTHISLFSYKQKENNYNAGDFPVIAGTAVVATFSRQLLLGKSGYFNMEVSKSSHHYNHTRDLTDLLPAQTSVSKQSAGNDNFLRQMALSFQWNGSEESKALDYDLHGTITGRAYNNPGNTFLSAGSTEFGGSLKKSLLQQKLQVSARVNYQSFAQGNNSQWQRSSFALQVKLKMKKGQYVSFQYQPNQMRDLQMSKNQIISAGSRASVDGNFRKRFGRIAYQHTIGISAISSSSLFDSIGVKNKSFLLSSMQTITVGNRSFYCNSLLNQAVSPLAITIFTTQLNVEAGMLYNVCKSLTGSSAISYTNVKGWLREAGIRQSFSGQLGARFIITMYANLAKNIRQYQFNNMGGSRLDWTLQYALK